MACGSCGGGYGLVGSSNDPATENKSGEKVPLKGPQLEEMLAKKISERYFTPLYPQEWLADGCTDSNEKNIKHFLKGRNIDDISRYVCEVAFTENQRFILSVRRMGRVPEFSQYELEVYVGLDRNPETHLFENTVSINMRHQEIDPKTVFETIKEFYVKKSEEFKNQSRDAAFEALGRFLGMEGSYTD